MGKDSAPDEIIYHKDVPIRRHGDTFRVAVGNKEHRAKSLEDAKKIIEGAAVEEEPEGTMTVSVEEES